MIRPLLALAGATAVGAVVLLAAPGMRHAEAAPCPPPLFTNSAGTLSISGASACTDDPEQLSVLCSAGTVHLDYSVNGNPSQTYDSAVACGAPSRIVVAGNYGADQIDLARVSAANGFTGISQPNVLDGGADADVLAPGPLASFDVGSYGSDILLLRNGKTDQANCGPDVDAVQTDAPGTDSLTDCEVVDAAATPASPKKKCKKKHGKRHHCKKRRAAT